MLSISHHQRDWIITVGNSKRSLYANQVDPIINIHHKPLSWDHRKKWSIRKMKLYINSVSSIMIFRITGQQRWQRQTRSIFTMDQCTDLVYLIILTRSIWQYYWLHKKEMIFIRDLFSHLCDFSSTLLRSSKVDRFNINERALKTSHSIIQLFMYLVHPSPEKNDRGMEDAQW